ncbi:hypothetical protein AB0I72_21610 [Nocardiopsis sp. NPDC049922]|uniref:hypothetical protein n=1 Tax=Nocardiopsis sp. NPDC049922 TaxID=3155157 RepID=UPI003411C7BD
MHAMTRWASALLATVLVLLALARHGVGEWDPATPEETRAHAAPPVSATAEDHHLATHGDAALANASPTDCSTDAPACWDGHPGLNLPGPVPAPDVVLPPPPVQAAPRVDRWSGPRPRAPDLSELSVLRI